MWQIIKIEKSCDNTKHRISGKKQDYAVNNIIQLTKYRNQCLQLQVVMWQIITIEKSCDNTKQWLCGNTKQWLCGNTKHRLSGKNQDYAVNNIIQLTKYT